MKLSFFNYINVYAFNEDDDNCPIESWNYGTKFVSLNIVKAIYILQLNTLDKSVTGWFNIYMSRGYKNFIFYLIFNNVFFSMSI